MTSTSDNPPRPASPSKGGDLRRNNVTLKHHRAVSGGSAMAAGKEQLRHGEKIREENQEERHRQDRGRSRNPPSPNTKASSRAHTPSPGKENRPQKISRPRPASPTRPSARERESTPMYKLGIPLRSASPERKVKSSRDARTEEAAGKVDKSSNKRDRSRSRSRVISAGERELISTEAQQINGDFSNMLTDMEVPPTLRQKLMTLEPKVMESMIKGKATLSLASLQDATTQRSGKIRPPISDKLRKSKSQTNIFSDGDEKDDEELMPPPTRSKLFGGGRSSRNVSGGSNSSSSSSSDNEPRKRGGFDKVGLSRNSSGNKSAISLSHSTGTLPHLNVSRSRAASFGSSSTAFTSSTSNASAGKAVACATMLKTTDAARLDVGKMKRMRVVLSSESPSWLIEFFDEGGYTAMLARLKELLDMEWREEQHDDQVLHEILRCFIALSTTDRGRAALQSSLPSPFVGLSDLLFSEKRPGDLSTRRMLIDLLIILADLHWPTSESSSSLPSVLDTREGSTCLDTVKKTADANFILTFCLLHNSRDAAQEAVVDFIKATHTPRPFKAFVNELLNVCRDYYWVFSHVRNRFWALNDLDIGCIEGPKIPSGATGGVEFEAMDYATALCRLLNRISAELATIGQRQDNHLAWGFHYLVFSSGIDRAIDTLRKSSQTYYQPLHLELSRYLQYVRTSGMRIPAELECRQDAPCKIAAPSASPLVAVESLGSDRKRSSPLFENNADLTKSTANDKRQSRQASSLEEDKGQDQGCEVNHLGNCAKAKEMAQNTGKWLGGVSPGSPKRSTARASHFFQTPRSPEAQEKVPPKSSSAPKSAAMIIQDAGKTRVGVDDLSSSHQTPGKGKAPTTAGAATNEFEFSGPDVPPKSIAQDSVVFNAVRKWEQLAQDSVKKDGNSGSKVPRKGLGLGWAPSQSR